MNKLGVGIIGCGNISDIYLKNLSTLFLNIELVGCADLVFEKAKAKSEEYGIECFTVDELLSCEDIHIIVNLTIPHAHKEVCEKALLAGKHVYVEKPLSLNKKDGEYLIGLAKEKDLYIGGAPDTFLGGGIQTCKKLIDEGWIGEIVGANAFMMCHGHESWHPDPEFYYKAGGGPMFDMGPYYITALVKLLGPISHVGGLTTKGFEKRIITSEKKYGQNISVDVPTHLVSLLKFEKGGVGQLTTSFDVWAAELPRIEIYGTKGTLSVPDPNTFGGPIRLRTKDSENFMEIPCAFGYTNNSRGLGVSNMADSIMKEDPSLFEASGNLSYHVLEIMEGIHESNNAMTFMEIKSRF